MKKNSVLVLWKSKIKAEVILSISMWFVVVVPHTYYLIGVLMKFVEHVQEVRRIWQCWFSWG